MSNKIPLLDFPDQTIPEKKKDENWHKDHLVKGWFPFYFSNYFSNQEKEIDELMDYHSCTMFPELEKKVKALITESCGSNLGPAYEIYPLIENKIEHICGTYRTRPIKRNAMVMNKEAVNKKLEKKMDLIIEKLVRPANQEIGQHIGFEPESPNPEQELPEDIELFISKNYRTQSEQIAESILYYILVVKQEQQQIIKALKYYLITERASFYIGEKDGHPTIITSHPKNFGMNPDPMNDIQRDPSYFIYHDFQTYNEVCNNYDLDEDKKEELKDVYKNFNSLSIEDQKHYEMRGSIFYYKVTTMIWKSTKTIKVKDLVNKNTDKTELKLLPEDFKDKRNVTKIEFDNLRHVTMIGHDVVLDYGSVENQMSTIANPRKKYIPAVGIINESNINNGEIRSIAKKLKFLQDLMSETLYEVKLALKQIDGNIMEYDSSSMPKEFLKNGLENGLKKVNYHIKKDRMMITNRKDRRNNSYATSINMGQNSRLKTLLDFFFVLDGIADKIVGLNDSATGQMVGYEKATVAEMQRYQSTIRIEDTLAPFEYLVNDMLQKLILKAKQMYKEGDILSYFAGDNSQQFIEITEDFLNEDIGLHMSDLSKEYEIKQNIDEIAKQAFGNAPTPELLLSLLEVINVESPTEAESILRKGVKELADAAKEREQQQGQLQEKEIEAKREAIAKAEEMEDKKIRKDIALKRMDGENKMAIKKMDNDQNLIVDLASIERDIINTVLKESSKQQPAQTGQQAGQAVQGPQQSPAPNPPPGIGMLPGMEEGIAE